MRRRPLDVVEHHVDGAQQKEMGQRPAGLEVGAHQERADVEMHGERLFSTENLGGRLQEPYRRVAHLATVFCSLAACLCKSGVSRLISTSPAITATFIAAGICAVLLNRQGISAGGSRPQIRTGR